MITVNNLSFSYAGQREKVFDDFSLQLEGGHIYGLLGKNGTGKSTLLYLLSGLLRPAEGTVCVYGIEARLRRPEVLQETFLVPEEYDLPHVSLDEYVRIYAPFYPHFDREVLDSCLNDFELSSDLHLGSLSMGQKKKVYMSFALAAGTRLLLMDEPTNGLDIPSKSLFRKVVAQHITEGRTLVISTHQVHDVEQLLDHILVLSRRQVLLDKSVGDLTDRYVFEYRQPQEMGDVVYAEPTLQGNAVVALRQAGQPETQLNLELLFNAVTKGLVK